MKPVLGEYLDTHVSVRVDMPRLLETRALIQANSGNGKSQLLRRLIEVTAGLVQQIVIDWEGEFASLREKFDFVICATQGGDVAVHPRTAALLARRLLETQVSAVLDVSELRVNDRHLFVKLFIESLMEAPKSLRHAVLIAADEAQVYCPEKGQGESEAGGAMIDLATRGRKRGLCMVGAVQRISMFHKGAAAELKNRMIGGTSLDVDLKRAAFDLGFTAAEARDRLRALEPGTFYLYGPAFAQPSPRLMHGGPVVTTHPKAGARGEWKAPPKPTQAILAMLPKLADLPKEAETELRTIEDLKRELATVRRDLTLAKRADVPVAAKELDAAEARGAARAEKEVMAAFQERLKTIRKDIGDSAARLMQSAGSPFVIAGHRLPPHRVTVTGKDYGQMNDRHQTIVAGMAKFPPIPQKDVKRVIDAVMNGDVTRSQQLILDKLAWLEQHGLYPAPKETLAAVVGVSPLGGGYNNNLGKLRNTLKLIDYPTTGMVAFTDAGRAIAVPATDNRPVHEHWLDILPPPQRKILEVLIQAHPSSMGKPDLAEALSLSADGGGFNNNLGRLRTLGAIDYPEPKKVCLTRYVMPE